MTSLLILGAGGHSKVVAETALATGLYSKLFFLDDKFKNKNFIDRSNKLLIGSLDDSVERLLGQFNNAVVALGDNHLRIKWINKLLEFNYNLPVIIHPKSYISPSAVINSGTVVFANSVIQSDVVIGLGGIINSSSNIEHDSSLGKGVHISPGVNISGEVEIKDLSWIGIGSSVINNIKIGKNVILGAGSVLIDDLPDGVKAAGVPAKILN